MLMMGLKPTLGLGLRSAVTASMTSSMIQGQNRTFATLKDIQIRLKSIKNISKITKSMKMIASTKLVRAQKAMETGRTFGKASFKLVEGVKPKEGDNANSKRLLVVCSSDRGLCGAIHSSVSKMAKRIVRSHPNTGIVILGDKAKPQVAREAKKNILMHFNQLGKVIPSYQDAIGIAQRVAQLQASGEFTEVTIIYNSFKSVISFDTLTMGMIKKEDIASSDALVPYELDEEFVLDDYVQFQLANSVFWGLVESHASEMSAKRMAMENATKNAGEIINALTMQYNNRRQAVITNELVDIITGASAL